MLLIYSHKITPRLTYVFKQICTRIIGVPVSFTTKVEEFIAHAGLKMSYTKQPLGNEFFVKSHNILFEQGFSDVNINIQIWKDTKCFFKLNDKSSLPFDIFAASFFLLSRYEEYLPHVKDEYGRFPAHESLAYKNNFLNQPVVDIWANYFQDALMEKFPNMETVNKSFDFTPIFDVPMAYRYKNKEGIRTVLGVGKDITRLNYKSILSRLRVLFGFKRDPYDTFKWILNHHKKRGIKPLFFFLLGDFSKHDRNIDYKNPIFRSLIKSVGDHARVGLKVSFQGLASRDVLKKEKQRIEGILNRPLQASRNSFTKLNLPGSYRNLVDLEIHEDYTMGYTSEIGFRAGTCTPFYFYDLDYEIQTPLKVHSFLVLDYVLLKEEAQDRLKKLIEVYEEVRKVNGSFIMVFHNYSFSEEDPWIDFSKLYLELLKHITGE